MEERFQVKLFLDKNMEELDRKINEFLIDKDPRQVLDIEVEVIESETLGGFRYFAIIKYMKDITLIKHPDMP